VIAAALTCRKSVRALVTEDGAPVPSATGPVRAGAPLRFATQTVRASTLFPDLDEVRGKPLEYRRICELA
jgi:hypothetical protein